MRYAVLATVSSRYPALKGRLLTRYSPVRHWSEDRSPRHRSTWMCYARRQRSSWARIKLSEKLYLNQFSRTEVKSLYIRVFLDSCPKLPLEFVYILKFKRIFGVSMYDIRLAPLSYGTFVDVVQFSMSDRCSFPSVCCFRSVTALLLYHIAFRLSRGFSNFFWSFLFFLDSGLPCGSCSRQLC